MNGRVKKFAKLLRLNISMKLINHTPFVIFLGEAILNILLNCED
jgi:hypothetical protein